MVFDVQKMKRAAQASKIFAAFDKPSARPGLAPGSFGPRGVSFSERPEKDALENKGKGNWPSCGTIFALYPVDSGTSTSFCGWARTRKINLKNAARTS
jgi:hypothetical protein